MKTAPPINPNPDDPAEVHAHTSSLAPCPLPGRMVADKPIIPPPTNFARIETKLRKWEKLQQAIKKTQAELTAIYDAAPFVMLLLNEHLQIRKANRTALTYSGACFEDIFGQCGGNVLRCRNAVHPEGNGCVGGPSCHGCALRELINDTLKRGIHHYRKQAKLVTLSNGTETDLWISASTIPLEIDDLPHALVCIEDITETKLMDDRLRKSHQKLEMRVRKRTEELEKSRARQAKAKALAETASAVKGQFLANMSHEIRTPLNAILGFAHLALQAAPSGPAGEYLRKIQVSSESLLDIINDILDFSKLEVGKLSLASRDFSIRQLLDELSDVVLFEAKDKDIRFDKEMDENIPPYLVGDPVRLKQVLLNLAVNAVKFTPSGTVNLRATLVRSSEANCVVLFSVADTGIGISKENREEVFKPFTQLDASSTRNYQGTGLGLAVSRQLVHLMGSEIALESAPGRGSTFSFSLCFQKPSEKTACDLPVSSTVLPDASESLALKRALIVEDNEINLLLMRALLQRHNILTDEAFCGDAAVKAASCQEYDIIFMDVQMPNVDGLEATRRIREIEKHRPPSAQRRTPIIGVTAHVMEGSREKCLESGMDDFLPKPLEMDRLLEMLSRWAGVSTPPPRQETSAPEKEKERPETGGYPACLGPVDFPSLLKRSRNDISLALRLLRNMENSRDIPRQIRQLLKDGQRQKALHQTDILKGMADNLSAHGLSRASRRLESLLRRENTENFYSSAFADRQIDVVQDAIGRILHSISHYEALCDHRKTDSLPSDTIHDTLQSNLHGQDDVDDDLSDTEEEKSIDLQLKELYQDLLQSRTSAEDRFRQICPSLEQEGCGTELMRLRSAIENYDFESAKEALQQLTNQRSTPSDGN